MSINTPHGATERILLPASVTQGDLKALMEASVQVNNLAKNHIEDEQEREQCEVPTKLYKYEGFVSIPILVMMNDTATLTEEGFTIETI